MDKYRKLFNDINTKTVEKRITWHPFNAYLYERIIFNTQYVWRALRADYSVDGVNYELVLVQYKTPQVTADGVEYDSHSVNLIVVHDDIPIVELNANSINTLDLYDLCDKANQSSPATSRLFESLEEEQDE